MPRLRRHTPRSPGFTLIELLVVIAIIAVLVAIGVTAFTSAQRQSRDARRRADVRSIQTAFEQYYLGNDQQYAADCGVMAASHMPAGLPQDPQGGSYNLSCPDTVSYCACAALENEGNGNSAANCNFSGTPKNSFCAQQQQ